MFGKPHPLVKPICLSTSVYLSTSNSLFPAIGIHYWKLIIGFHLWLQYFLCPEDSGSISLVSGDQISRVTSTDDLAQRFSNFVMQQNQWERFLKYKIPGSLWESSLRWGPGTCILIRASGGPDSHPLPWWPSSSMSQQKHLLDLHFPNWGNGYYVSFSEGQNVH